KVVVVGDGGCGKTCLLVSYAQGIFPERYVPTVFENYVTTTTAPNGKSIELALWDTAGQEEYDRLRPLSYPDVNVLLVCFAVDSRASLENAKDKWIPEVSHHCPGIPTVLVALKTDLRQDPVTITNLKKQGSSGPITWAEGKQVADETGAAYYMECSAKMSEGVSDIFSLSITMAVKENFKAKPK
ncbi:ras family GTP-binding protein Rho1p, partial [Nadsonia fulvescens var. elongata DSM 6958]